MDTTARRRRAHATITETVNDAFILDVTMYQTTPEGEIRFEEFEELALERVQLLRILELASIKGHRIYSSDWLNCVKEDLAKANLKKYLRLLSGQNSPSEIDKQGRRADFISHNILRIAYCRSEDLRRWFLAREMEWFKIRFMAQSKDGVAKFLKVHNLTYSPIESDIRDSLKEELIESTYMLNEVTFETMDFFKVPFTEVTSLVQNRKVFLKEGFAYILRNDLVICMVTKFRAFLNKALNHCYQNLPKLDDERITSFLNSIHNSYSGKSYTQVSNDAEAVRPEDLNAMSKQSFPLCMRSIHEILMATHHLKHEGRLQYGLFLKGIGMLYEDALEFWKTEFTKNMDLNKFEKQYAYNIKHSYGKVGGRTSYTPFSCIKIIQRSAGMNDHHGCPFKTWDPVFMDRKLKEYGVNPESVQQIIELVKGHHYQIACTKYFESVHKVAPEILINHPNQYVEESRNIKKKSDLKKSTLN